MKLVPIISDIQYPLHDPQAVDLAGQIVEFINEPAVCVGDEFDQWQLSRWCRGLKGEHDSLDLSVDRFTVLDLLEDLHVEHVMRSNHGETRLENYLMLHAPALVDLPELSYETYMGFAKRGIKFHREPYEVAPGWLLVHGDEGSLIRSAGGTAMNIAKQWGMSIACGHTHRMGIQHHHVAYGGKVRREVWGFEVGNLMQMQEALYLKGGYGNWQQGIGVLAIDGDDVTPIPVPFRNGKAYFNGRRFVA
jgi:hypothetical protein